MHLFSLLMLQALAACLAYDIQTEGEMRMVKDHMRVLKENQIEHAPEEHTKRYPKKSKNPFYKRSEDILPTKSKELMDYVYHIQNKGKKAINHLGRYIQADVNLEGDVSHLIDNVINDFETKLQKYLNRALSEKTVYEIDEEYVFLDAVCTTNKFLHGAGRKLLNDIVHEPDGTATAADVKLINTIQTNKLNKLLYKLNKDSVTSKKEEMEFICSNYKVCRNYPSFTDYSADFISDILKMPNSKFERVIDVFRDILKSKRSFFESIIRYDDLEIIIQQMEILFKDTSSIKEFLSVLRAVMIQRFKIDHNSNDMLKAKTKSVRILLDILDKALLYEDEDVVAIGFSNAVHSMRSWVGGQRDDIDKILRKFFDNIIKSLNFVITNNTRTEIKTLVQVILRGRSDYAVYTYLNRFGSKFVAGKDTSITNDIDIF